MTQNILQNFCSLTSQGYNIFTGLAETVPAILLFYRRTTTLGALLATIAMTNVVALNFFFDVPVKLFSSHLLLMSIFLLLPDLKALSDLLIFQREVLPAPVRPAFSWPRFNLAWQITKTVLLCISIGTGTYFSLRTYRGYNDHSARPLYGAYQVQSFFQDGKSEPLKDSPWRDLIMMHGLLRARHSDGTSNYAYTSRDQKLVLTESGSQIAEFNYSQPDTTRLVLNGELHSRKMTLVLKKLPEDGFPLMNRGFRWINEYPFNR